MHLAVKSRFSEGKQREKIPFSLYKTVDKPAKSVHPSRCHSCKRGFSLGKRRQAGWRETQNRVPAQKARLLRRPEVQK